MEITDANGTSGEETTASLNAMEKKIKDLGKEIERLNGELEKRQPIVAFLDYVEDYFTAERNQDALVVKELLLDLYPLVTDAERERLRRLGTKPNPSHALNVYGPLNDVHHNEYVKAGM